MKQRTALSVRRSTIWVLVAILVAGLTACMTNPATGERRFSLISMDQEIRMGSEADLHIGESMGIYPNELLQAYVSGLGTTMAATTEWPELPWTFRVVDDDTVNAFALPGGYVYVTRGILAHFNSEAQLAGVLGHEIGHVTARHAATRLTRMQMTQLGVGLAMVLEPKFQRIAPLAGAGMQLLFLSFSRSDEQEADELGVRYMVGMGYDPEALISVMETLRRVSESGGQGRLPEWLATHPHPENRQDDIRGHAAALAPQDYRSDGRAEYLSRIDGIVYGPDPREGYLLGGAFYHPTLRFVLDFPQGWTVINQKQAVIALSRERDASVQLTVSEETSIGAAAQSLYSIEGVDGAGITRTRISGLPAGTGSFTVRTEQGQIEGSAAFIEYDGRVYQLIGYSAASTWEAYRRPVAASLESFQTLTARSALEVEPMRLDVTRVTRVISLRSLYDTYYSGVTPAVSVEEIGLINQLDPDSRLEAGMLVKMVYGSLPR